MLPTCKGTVGRSFVACGEGPEGYGYYSPECEAAANIQKMSFGGDDYNFITDRLAIGNVALGFVSARRPGACPAPCFIEAIKRWLRLDELATTGPRR